MKIVITGAAGYIGSRLTADLLNHGHEVFCFDNLFFGQHSLTESVFEHPKCHFFEESVLDWSPNLKEAISRSDVIYPLAAMVGAPLCKKHPELTKALNQDWLGELLPRLHGQLLILPNTNSSYGSYDGVCDEDTPLNPLSLYAETKDAGEKIVHAYPRSTCFRLATVFGGSFRTRTDLLINNLVGTSLGEAIEVFDGHFRRNYVHIGDVVTALKMPMYDQRMRGQIYNLGNDEINSTKLKLVQDICRLTGGSYSVVDNKTDPDKRDYEVSSKKLYSMGFRPKFDLEYGVKQMADLYRSGLSLTDPRCRNY
jgi:nucleoside-diphosphate-sugar epimerase